MVRDAMRWSRPALLGLTAWGALFFANGRFAWAPAAWVGPFLLLRYLRAAPGPRGLAVGYGMVLSVTLAQWWGAWGPLRGPVVYAGVALGAVLLFAPYLLAERLTTRDHAPDRRWGSTLVFPCALVSAELGFALVISTEGALGYTQVHVLPLLQLASVTGVFGISFLVAWFAAVASWIVDRWPARRPALLAVLGYAATLAIVLGLGAARLAASANASAPPALTVASFTLDNAATWRAARALMDSVPDRNQEDALRGELQASNERLLERADREAAAGAELVAWSEVNALVATADLEPLLQRAGVIARRRGAYLAMAIGIVEPGRALLENQLIVVDPSGAVVSRYEKSFLAPGEPSVVGDWRLRSVSTPRGLVSGAICADLSRHRLLRQAGEMNADLVIAPAVEWPEIDPIQTHVAIFRAVESGFTLVKETHSGPSAVVDPYGRVIAWRPRTEGDTATLRAIAPMRGSRTIYSRIGDTFGFACVGLLALLGLLARRRRAS